MYDKNGAVIKSYSIGNLISPSNESIKHLINTGDIDINEITSFGVKANSVEGKIPTRVTHQLVYGRGKAKCSINTSLFNENIYRNPDQGTFSWGELIIGSYNSLLCLTAGSLLSDTKNKYEVELSIYSSSGLIKEDKLIIIGGTSLILSINQYLQDNFNDSNHNYLWYAAKSKKAGLTAYTISWNTESNHCSGEHSF